MAAADCDFCRMAGYRTCDQCAGIVFRPNRRAPRDLCPDCLDAARSS